MSRLSKEESARYEGANWCLQMIDKVGLEETRREMKIRGVNHCPLQVSRADVARWESQAKINVINTTMMAQCRILIDKFGFTKDMIEQYKREFNGIAESLQSELITWDDVAESLYEEDGLLFELSEVEGRRR